MARAHPHFDDRGTLDWHVEWSGALAQAKRDGKLVLVEFGREQCGQCRALVEAVVPRPDVAPLLKEGFVALASDCDDPEPEVLELAESMPDATMLPFVMIADGDGRFLAGSSGAVAPKELRRMLEGVLGG